MGSSAKISWYGDVPLWLKHRENECALWMLAVCKERGYSVAKLTYTFCDDKEILEHNVKLLNHDYPTDIITLDHTAGRKRLSVEMFIGYQQIENFALENSLPFEEELCRVLVHGALHCMGWDDKTIEAKYNMRKEEDLCLLSRPK